MPSETYGSDAALAHLCRTLLAVHAGAIIDQLVREGWPHPEAQRKGLVGVEVERRQLRIPGGEGDVPASSLRVLTDSGFLRATGSGQRIPKDADLCALTSPALEFLRIVESVGAAMVKRRLVGPAGNLTSSLGTVMSGGGGVDAVVFQIVSQHPGITASAITAEVQQQTPARTVPITAEGVIDTVDKLWLSGLFAQVSTTTGQELRTPPLRDTVGYAVLPEVEALARFSSLPGAQEEGLATAFRSAVGAIRKRVAETTVWALAWLLSAETRAAILTSVATASGSPSIHDVVQAVGGKRWRAVVWCEMAVELGLLGRVTPTQGQVGYRSIDGGLEALVRAADAFDLALGGLPPRGGIQPPDPYHGIE